MDRIDQCVKKLSAASDVIKTEQNRLGKLSGIVQRTITRLEAQAEDMKKLEELGVDVPGIAALLMAATEQLAALADSVVPKTPAAKKHRKQTEKPPLPIPLPRQKKAPKPKDPPRGILSQINAFLGVLFPSNENPEKVPVPTSLEQAMEMVWGSGWPSTKLYIVGNQPILAGEDLKSETSHFKAALAKTIAVILEGCTTPQNTKLPPHLEKLCGRMYPYQRHLTRAIERWHLPKV